MTRKDYVRIADSVKENLLYNPEDRADEEKTIYLSDLLFSLCRELKEDNPNFSEKRFREYIME